MADTLTNIDIVLEDWIDIYSESGISSRTPISIQNIGVSDLYYTISPTKPPRDFDKYKIFHRETSITIADGDQFVWVFSPQKDGLVNVSILSDVLLVPRDFFVEVAKGNVAGHTNVGLVQQSRNVANINYSDLWFPGGVKEQAAANEIIEVLSTDSNDTDGGTGANSIIFYYLDENYERQSSTVLLNGTTPVQVATDYFRNDPLVSGTTFIVLSSGSNGTNIGDITIRRASDGVVRSVIPADEGRAFDGHFTVPDGFTAYARQSTPFFSYNERGKVRGRAKLEGTDTWFSTGNFQFYQNAFDIDIEALVPFPSRADFKFQALNEGSTGMIEVNLVLELLLVEDGF